MIFWKILFWLSLAALAHSYILYPALLWTLSRISSGIKKTVASGTYHPPVTVILAVYNEEGSLEEKIRSVFSTHYEGMVDMIVGSDASTDRTHEILERMESEFRALKTVVFSSRMGKGNILNRIVPMAQGEVLLLTDAKVIFTPGTIPALVRRMEDPATGIAAGRLVNRTRLPNGISIQESAFMDREIGLKVLEGSLWGCTIGAYGALYAIRKESYTPVPENCIADDFFVSMKVLESGKKVILEPEAYAFLNVPNAFGEEFRRKVRISMGNFQNLDYFKHWLLFPFRSRNFAFLSHKVLRWTGPLWILLLLLSGALLAPLADFYRLALFVQVFTILLPLLDYLLRKIHTHVIPLRFITHFYHMNLALALGLFKYLKGVRTNVWEPTRR